MVDNLIQKLGTEQLGLFLEFDTTDLYKPLSKFLVELITLEWFVSSISIRLFSPCAWFYDATVPITNRLLGDYSLLVE